jgi:gluconate kinase
VRDSVLEAWITRNGATFTYHESVELSDIVVEPSAIQNIRLGLPLDEDKSIQYSLDYNAGAQFPPLILYKIVKGKYIGRLGVINGLHRLKALVDLVLAKTIDAYLIETRDEITIEKMQRTVNVMAGGVGLNDEERIEHALRFVALDYSMADAAKLMAIKVSKLQTAKQYQDAIAKLRSAGVKTEGLTKGQVVGLRPIKRDKHYIMAIQLVQKARLGSDDQRELLAQITAAPDDAAVEQIIKEWEEHNKSRISRVGAGLTRGPASRIYALPAVLRKTDRILQGPGNLAVLTAREIDGIIRLAGKAIVDLRSLIDTLKKTRRNAS